MRGFRQRFTAAAGVAATVALAAAGLVAVAPAAGAAVVLDVTATPSTGLRDGDQVVLTVSNLDAANLIAVGQCDASVLDSGTRSPSTSGSARST